MATMIPNMMPEIVEAVHLFHEDNPDVELDCMMYLKHLVADDPRALSCVMDWFKEHERCELCGAELKSYTYLEPHSELDGCPCERLSDVLCPECDVEWRAEVSD